MQMCSGMAQESIAWTKFAFGLPCADDDDDDTMVDQENDTIEYAIERCQEAYDQCTRVSGSISDSCKELLKLVAPDSLAAGTTRTAVQACQQMRDHIIKMEGILFFFKK